MRGRGTGPTPSATPARVPDRARASRRRFVAGAVTGALAAPALLGLSPARATPREVEDAIRAIAKGGTPREGRVSVEAPALAETGNAVPVVVRVGAAASEGQRCIAIHILVEQNPEAEAAQFLLGPRCGKAEVQTRLRIFSPQRIFGVAVMRDGGVWFGSAHVEVTLAACLETEVR